MRRSRAEDFRTVRMGRSSGAASAGCGSGGADRGLAARASALWGPRKLRALLQRRHPGLAVPAASTIGDLLRREGLVERRRRRHRPVPQASPFAAVEAANDTWCIDFKGWFTTGDGERCDPLTVSDAYSRYLLACVIVPPTRRGCGRWSRGCCAGTGCRRDPQRQRAAFCERRRGRPEPAFGALAEARHPARADRSGLRPQQNGRHERMHRTLKKDTAAPAAANARAQQARFDAFRQRYNHERPHEALGQVPPAALWTQSPRRYRKRVAEPIYAAGHAVRRVRSNGEIRVRRRDDLCQRSPDRRDGRRRRDRERRLARALPSTSTSAPSTARATGFAALRRPGLGAAKL